MGVCTGKAYLFIKTKKLQTTLFVRRIFWLRSKVKMLNFILTNNPNALLKVTFCHAADIY